MNITTSALDKASGDTTKVDYAQCHSGIVSKLMSFSSLPALLEQSEKVRQVAQEAMDFFRETVQEHHSEEESDLFPAVLAAAEGDEFARVKAIVERLTLEHRQVEAMWSKLEPDLEKIAQGEPANLDPFAVQTIVLDYGAHASYEEAEFLPLCRSILGRKFGYAELDLDLSQPLHVPRAPGTVSLA